MKLSKEFQEQVRAHLAKTWPNEFSLYAYPTVHYDFIGIHLDMFEVDGTTYMLKRDIIFFVRENDFTIHSKYNGLYVLKKGYIAAKPKIDNGKLLVNVKFLTPYFQTSKVVAAINKIETESVEEIIKDFDYHETVITPNDKLNVSAPPPLALPVKNHSVKDKKSDKDIAWLRELYMFYLTKGEHPTKALSLAKTAYDYFKTNV